MADLVRRRLHELRADAPTAAVDVALPSAADGERLVIGRSRSCDLVLADATVSRRHAALTREHGRWVLSDLDSRNGLRRDGWRVQETEVHPGSEIAMGDVRPRFRA